MAKVLIIDDERELCSLLHEFITNVQHEAEYVLTLREGLKKALSGDFDVVFLDVQMPDGNGLNIMRKILATNFPPEVIVMTGKGNSDGAETAIRNGAWDYIQKPLSLRRIAQSLNRVLQYRDGVRAAERPVDILDRKDIIGSSQAIGECLSTIAKAANNFSTVLITGETGTGKELFARAIHNNSKRADKNFVVVDCAALPESLVESALFGYEKGAFTGAEKSVNGLIALADGGTLFLDEVGEMNLNLQKAFLRVLQERRYRPVGSKEELTSDFRLVSATNRNPTHMVKDGLFREDLLYRLNTIALRLPPLRERITDLPELVDSLGVQTCNIAGVAPKEWSQEVLSLFRRYPWPGNIRELINTLQAAVNEAMYEPVVFPKHLPEYIRVAAARSKVESHSSLVRTSVDTGILEKPLEKFHAEEKERPLPLFKEYRREIVCKAEEKYLQDLMRVTRGDIKVACQLSGLGRTRLYTLLKEHNIDRTGWGMVE